LKNKDKRPSWDKYFLDAAIFVATRATCLRRAVGAVVVRDKRILSTGYNGAPVGLKHCLETGCLREKFKVASGTMHELCRGLHAEQNCIIQAALYGISLKDAEIYITNFPCSICARMLINAGIRKIKFLESYNDELSYSLLREAKIGLFIWDKKKEKFVIFVFEKNSA
jgi:dCMP deaminase